MQTNSTIKEFVAQQIATISNLLVFKVFFRRTLTWQTSVQKFLFKKKFLAEKFTWISRCSKTEVFDTSKSRNAPTLRGHSKTSMFLMNRAPFQTTTLENLNFLIHSILTQRVAMNKLLLQINRNIYPTLLLDTLQFFVSYETSEIEVFKSWWCIDFLILWNSSW